MKTYLIVDGYNLIHALFDNAKAPDFSLEEAREDLVAALENYGALMAYETVVVFDAYNDDSPLANLEERAKITVVYTGKGVTADAYIEKMVYELPKSYGIKVVTSDYTLQRMILGVGGERIPSRELVAEMGKASIYVKQLSSRHARREDNRLGDYADPTTRDRLEDLRKG